MIFKSEKYDRYATKVCKELQRNQILFRERFEIDTYENWFYNQASEILRLSNFDKEIYFRYIPVGTFSKQSNTWKWVWDNDDSLEPGRYATLKIKEFGEKRNYEKLKKGYFDGDEYTGWELTGISYKILGGLGAYRVISDQIEKYMIITEIISKEEVGKIESKLIECQSHEGKFRKTFICQHLFDGSGKGFEESFETTLGMELDEEDNMQAWCSACEIERVKTDGWNDESMKYAKIKLICEMCYFEIKSINLISKA